MPLLALALLALVAAPRTTLAIPAAAPVRDLVRDRWTSRDGLPIVEVASVAASASGYLWLGTEEGPVRFDGSRFAVFDRAAEPKLAISSTRIVLEDPSGALWAGSDAGLAVRRGRHFEPVPLEGRERVGIRAIAAASDGSAWIGTDHGLFRVAPGAKVATWDRRTGVASIVAVASDGSEGLWAGGPWGVAHLPAAGALRRLDAGALGASCQALERQRDGGVWIGGIGLYRLAPGAERPALVPGSEGLRVNAFLTDRDGVLWIATSRGLYRLVDGLEPVPLEGAPVPMPVVGLAEDGEGSIWVASVFGLHRLRVGVAATVGALGELSADMVNAVLEAPGGEVWLATNGGLDVLRGRAIEHVPLPLAAGEPVLSLDRDGQGRTWVGTDRRVFRLEGGSRRELRSPAGGWAGRVRAVLVDADGVAWAGTTRGLYRLQGDRFLPAPDAGGEAVRPGITSLARGPSGAVWACGQAGVGPIAGGRFEPIPGTGSCYGLTIGADGVVSAGEYGGGLLRIAGSRVERFTTSHGLLEENVLNAVDDGLGSVWLSGNRGVQRISLAELDAVAQGRARSVTPLRYGTADGMADRECNAAGTPSLTRGADGRLWFATVKGAVVFDPRRAEPSPPPPRAAIEEVWVDGAVVDPEGELRVPPGTRRLAIRYAGLASAPDRLRFRHQLVGFEDRPIDAGAERTVQYTGLPPGRYRFVVWALRERGVASQRPAELAFVLEPHFWQTAWFRAGLWLSLGIAIVAFERIRSLSARRREAELGRRVAEEMAKAEIHRGGRAEEALARAADLQRMSAHLSHELKNPLGAIKALVQLSARRASDPSVLARLEVVQGEVERMQSILQGYLSFSRPLEALRPEPVSLGALADEVTGILEGRAEKGQVSLRRTGDAAATADPRRLKEALLNLVANAIEATPPRGVVEVRIAPTPGGARIEVRDTGLGMPPEVLARIGTPFFTTRQAGTGLGVSLARLVFVQHGGTLEYASTPGGGTVATATLPAPRPLTPARTS